MAERTKLNLTHLIVIGRRLIREHGLTVGEVVNPKATLKKLRETPSVHKVEFYRQNGEFREKWGPDYGKEYAYFLKTYKKRLEKDYPRDRSWWPTALHVMVVDGGAKLDKEHPWLAWFEAILGQPYPEFPPEMDWKALIHQVWLDRSRQWRFEWEVRFQRLYPDAEDSVLVGPGNGNIWGQWRLLSYVRGFGIVEGTWEETTFMLMADEQDMAEAVEEAEAAQGVTL